MTAAIARIDPRRWDRAVHMRWACDVCHERHEVARIPRRGKEPVRVCRTCYADGFWLNLP